MKTFNELENQGLQWTSRGVFKRSFELRTDDGELLGTMTRPSMWRSLMEVEAPGNRWTFERTGFFRRHIVIRSVGTGEEPAEFHYHLQNGRLEFPDGRVVYWRQSNWMGTKWSWVTADGEPIVGFKTKGILQFNADIHLDTEAAQTKSLSLLVFLGWYIINLYQEDSAAVSVVATT